MLINITQCGKPSAGSEWVGDFTANSRVQTAQLCDDGPLGSWANQPLTSVRGPYHRAAERGHPAHFMVFKGQPAE